MLVEGFVGGRFFLAIFLLVAVVGLALVLRQSAVELRVNKLEFETTGYSPGNYGGRRTEARMNIQGLEYRSGAEGVPGLYADMPFYWACLLPYISEQQANEIIERIYRRFPDTPTAADPYKNNLTTLELH
ncbi:MAG TPA: hypothetical protein VFU86_07070 [Terriglobales bacterium]|nr:hypothetical protein [Terriglobales bacterium]